MLARLGVFLAALALAACGGLIYSVGVASASLFNAPVWTGNGTNLELQGGTTTQNLYTRGWQAGSWQAYCNQYVKNGAGKLIGFYVDDQVNDYPGPPASASPPPIASGTAWANEANCTWWDHETYPGKRVIDGIPPKRTWSFARWGGINAQEWYPVCGNKLTATMPSNRVYWIIQWNFVWPGCGSSPWSLIKKVRSEVMSTSPKLVLYF